MPVLTSKLNPRAADVQASALAMRALVADLNAKLATIVEGGGEAARAKHTARGKLLPRERVEMLLDPDTPFLEIGAIAAPAAGAAPFPVVLPDVQAAVARSSANRAVRLFTLKLSRSMRRHGCYSRRRARASTFPSGMRRCRQGKTRTGRMP